MSSKPDECTQTQNENTDIEVSIDKMTSQEEQQTSEQTSSPEHQPLVISSYGSLVDDCTYKTEHSDLIPIVKTEPGMNNICEVKHEAMEDDMFDGQLENSTVRNINVGSCLKRVSEGTNLTVGQCKETLDIDIDQNAALKVEESSNGLIHDRKESKEYGKSMG